MAMNVEVFIEFIDMVREIKNERLRAMLDKAGYNKVCLYKDSTGLFYVDDNEIDGICSKMESQCIYMCNFNQITVRQWADMIIDMCNEAKDK